MYYGKEYIMYEECFNEIIDRNNANQRALSFSMGKAMFGNKVSEILPGYTSIPMWVADTSFALPDFISDALKQRIDQKTFGYFYLDDRYYQAIIHWLDKRHQVKNITLDDIGFCNGVVGGVFAALAMDGKENDAVLIHNPCYIGFKRAANLAKRTLVYSDLIMDESGLMRMDFKDMEEKIKQYNIKKMILCSPHNPSGRVWEKEELIQLINLALTYDMVIVVDEIWSDIVCKDYEFTSLLNFNPIRNHLIYLAAPSKTFSLAGLSGSYDVVFNPELKNKYEQFKHNCGFNKANALSCEALIAAYNQGDMWVDQLNEVIHQNLVTMRNFILSIDGLKCALPQGTYMLYVDCTDYCRNHQIDLDELLAKGVRKGVLWQDGRPFGHPCSIRINVALPPILLAEAIQRLSGEL